MVLIQNCSFRNVSIGIFGSAEGCAGLEIDSSRFEAELDSENKQVINVQMAAGGADYIRIARSSFAVGGSAKAVTLLNVASGPDCVFADNIVSATGLGCTITAARSKLLAVGNALDGVGVIVDYGGLVSGNRMKGGYINASNIPYAGDTQERLNSRMVSVSGNDLIESQIFADGGVEVSGNTVNAAAGGAAIVVRKKFANNAPNAGPGIVGNFITGGAVGILLTKLDTISEAYVEASHALICGNRIRDCETPIQIEANWSGCLVSNNLFDGSVVDYGTDNIIRLNNDDAGGGSGTAAGVASFKGRTGAVTPQAGDYTAAMVGAATPEQVTAAIQAAVLDSWEGSY